MEAVAEIILEINKHIPIHSQKMTLRALISNIAITVSSQKEHKVQKLHFERPEVTPNVTEIKCYHSQWAHCPYTAHPI